MSVRRLLVALAWMLLVLTAHAADASLPRLTPRTGAALPLQEGFIDDDGKAVRLGQLFNGPPVLLVPGYYHCTNLCSTLFQGVLEALAASNLPPDSYRLIGISIDPDEDAHAAAEKKAAWLPVLGKASDMHLLSGRPKAITRLLDAAGWQVRYDRELKQYLHPAGFVVVTPDGRLSRYFTGLRFDAAELRHALHDAAGGRTSSLVDQVLLLCGHEGWLQGRHTAEVMRAVRLTCLALLLLGALWLGWLWRLRQRPEKRA